MATVRLGAFPSLNNKSLQDEIAKIFVKWFCNRFPAGFFNHIYIDTQISNANSYFINSATGELQKLESGAKIQQPALRVNIKQGSNNMHDVFGSLWNVNQQPGAFAIDTNLTGYKPFLYDCYGVTLATNDYTVRNNVEIIVSLQTKADQLAFFNIADTNIKNMYVQTIDEPVSIMIPTLYMEYIRDCVFKPELIALEKMEAGSDEKAAYRQKINDLFADYLHKFSGGAIKPFTEQVNDAGIKNYAYKLKRKHRITLHLDRPDGDEGTKKGSGYTNFQVTFSGWIEYANPVTFMSSVPAIIRGTKNDYFIRTSSKTDAQNNYKLMEFKEVFNDNRHLLDIDGSKWAHFYFEKEILMASNTENFNILDDVIVEEDTPSHYYIMKALLTFMKTNEDFRSTFKVCIYKGDEPLDPVDYTIDKDFNFTIRNCDLSKPYYIDVFINRGRYENYMEFITGRLQSIGIIIDGNESNTHVARGRGWFYLTKQYKSIDTETNANVIFIPIKTRDFEKADPQFDYYTLNIENEYIPIKNEVIEARPDLPYFMKTPDGTYVKIDRNKIMIPDPEYNYYIFDKNSHSYKECKKIKSFDVKNQYYVQQNQLKYAKIVASVEEN